MDDELLKSIADLSVTGPLSAIGCSSELVMVGESAQVGTELGQFHGSPLLKIALQYHQGTVDEEAISSTIASCSSEVPIEESCSLCFSEEVPLIVHFICWTVIQVGAGVLAEAGKMILSKLAEPFAAAAKQRQDGGELHVTISVPGGLWVDVVTDLRDEAMLEKVFECLDDMALIAHRYALVANEHSSAQVEKVGFKLYSKNHTPQVLFVAMNDGKRYADNHCLLYDPFLSKLDEE